MQLDPALSLHSILSIQCDRRICERAEDNEHLQAARQHTRLTHEHFLITEICNNMMEKALIAFQEAKGSEEFCIFSKGKKGNKNVKRKEKMSKKYYFADFCTIHCCFSLSCWNTLMNLAWVSPLQFSKWAFTGGKLRECPTRIYPKS